MTTQTITLKHPFRHGSTEIAALAFRRLRAGDLQKIGKAAEEGVVAAQIATLAAITDTTVDVIGDLDIEDFEAASEIAATFFPKAPPPAGD